MTTVAVTKKNKVANNDSDENRYFATLLDDIAKGNQISLKALYDSVYHRLYRYAMRMLKKHEDAVEVINDTFVYLWNNAAQFRGEAKVSTWVFSITHMLCLSSLKHRGAKKIRMAISLEALAIETADEADDAHDNNSPTQESEADFDATSTLLESDDALFTLSEGIEQLNTKHKCVILLLAQGYSYREIGNIVRCSENTVKSRVFYARKALKQYLMNINSSISGNNNEH